MKTTMARGFTPEHAAQLFVHARKMLPRNLNYSCAWLGDQGAVYEPGNPPDDSPEAYRLSYIAYDTVMLLFRACPGDIDGLTAWASTNKLQPTDIGGRLTAALAGRDEKHWALSVIGESKLPRTPIDDRLRMICCGGEIIKATRTINHRRQYPVQPSDIESIKRSLSDLTR